MLRALERLRGLSTKIYVAFLVTALAPAAIAGLWGIYYALQALERETLLHLNQEVENRADALGRFAGQLASELHYLSNAPALRALARGAQAGAPDQGARQAVIADFLAFARAYPYIYQMRYISSDGMEQARVDRRDDQPLAVPDAELQNKSDRYYLAQGLAVAPGGVYISPLDLNVERGRIERPERPVVRFAVPVREGAGDALGILIVNLHGDFVLDQVRQLAERRGAVAYLFDRSGRYLVRGAEGTPQSFEMRPASALEGVLGKPLLERIVAAQQGTAKAGAHIVAYAAVKPWTPAAGPAASVWSIALAYPEQRLFAAVFNLYLIFGVSAFALVVTAAIGFLVSRHMLGPLSRLQKETQAIAGGDFSRRVAVHGSDEIADLGRSFNRMAAEIDEVIHRLERHKQRLEDVVAARTAQLALERRKLDRVIQHTADGILVIAPDGLIELANRAALRLFGPPDAPLAGRPVTDIWPEAHKHLGGAEPSQVREAQLARDGREIKLTLTTMHPDSGAAHTIVLARDITEERRMQQERRELDRQLFQSEKIMSMGELAMGLAHEIGNPLAGMKAVVQALLESEDLDERTRRYLGRLEAEINRLAGFLHGFRGASARAEAHPAPCRLDEVLEDVLLWTRKEARSKSIQIEYAEAQGAPALWADPDQLRQLLLNLVINALHALPEGGRLSLGLEAQMQRPARAQDAPRARFWVEDNGTGIAPEVLPRIFDPFFTTRDSGSGLGLAVVKKIALQHGADIRVMSGAQGGTRFELDWPLALGEGEATDRSPHAA